MTVDERIGALAQTVELLATFHRDSEARMNRLVSAVETLTAHMQTLTTIALDHDRRIQKLES